jgi:uncharacterized protein
MKKIILIISCWILLPGFLYAQDRDYRVVFDCTSKDTMDHKALIRWMNEVTKADPNAKVEAVFYALSLGMVTKDRSVVANDIAKLLTNKNVSFRVCEVAMQNQKVEKSQLLPGIETVPDGIYEIILKQREGWGYIKAKL